MAQKYSDNQPLIQTRSASHYRQP